MTVRELFDASVTPFEGDRAFALRRVPEGARIVSARATITPVARVAGAFTESIRFVNGAGDFGASQRSTDEANAATEVDFRARRTLCRVDGDDLTDTVLQVDVGGGVFATVADGGTIAASGENRFVLSSDRGPPWRLPGLTVTRFRLWNPSANTGSPAPVVQTVVVESVPSNVNLTLGRLTSVWRHLGDFTEPATSADFRETLETFLLEAEVSDGFYVIPLVLHTDTLARMSVEVEIAFQHSANALPEEIDEVALTFGLGGKPESGGNAVSLEVPRWARVQEVSATVRGAFDESRVVPVEAPDAPAPHLGGEDESTETAPITSEVAQAHPVRLERSVDAEAVDVQLSATSRTARVQLDLRRDRDGKPHEVSLLSRPTEVVVDRDAAGRPTWISAPLAERVQLEAGTHWVVVQGLEGEALLHARAAPGDSVGLQHSSNGGLSWQRSDRSDEPLAAVLRLRERPPTFTVPIELLVGEGAAARRVRLPQTLDALGRIDFTLDLPELTSAVNDFLTTQPAPCPEREHLANADFTAWTRQGDRLGVPSVIPGFFDGSRSSAGLAVSPDGRVAVVLTRGANEPRLHVVDLWCGSLVNSVGVRDLPEGASLRSLRIDRAGRRAYVLTPGRVVAIDIETGRVSVATTESLSELRAFSLSVSGNELLLAVGREGGMGFLEIAGLDEAIRPGAGGAAIPLPAGAEPRALVLSPDGHRAFVLVGLEDGTAAAVRVHDAAMLQFIGPEIAVSPTARGLAVSRDGGVAVSVEMGVEGAGGAIERIDTSGETATRRINPGVRVTAAAIAPDGTRAFVAGENDVLAVSLERPSERERADLVGRFGAIAVTPAGDRFLVIAELTGQESANFQLVSIPIGDAVPQEWTVAGDARPECLPEAPRFGIRLDADRAPVSVSQVTPVAPACTHEFSFRAVATEDDAVAEIHWLSAECELLRTDTVAIRRADEVRAAFEHRVRLSSPAEAAQAEVRFSVDEGSAFVGSASLRGTLDAIGNGSLAARADGGAILDWIVSPPSPAGFASQSADAGTLVSNLGPGEVQLEQVIEVGGGTQLTLEVDTAPNPEDAAEDPARLELRFLGQDGDALAEPTTLALGGAVAARRTAPAEPAIAHVSLHLPPGAAVLVRRVALRVDEPVRVPVTFLSQTPGELVVTDWRVSYDRDTPLPPVPAGGLCAPTAPGDTPGGRDETDCYCRCCCERKPIEDAVPGMTPAGRPARIGRCATCGAEMVILGGRAVPGAMRVPATPLPAPPGRTFRLRGAASTPPLPAPLPLTAVSGLGSKLAERLKGAGIVSLDRLAESKPEAVVTALEGIPGLSLAMAANYITQARALLRRP